MKSYISILIVLLTIFPCWSQSEEEGLKIKDGSFKNTNSINAKAEDSLGSLNMFAKNIEWGNDDYSDADGNDDVALLLVSFENISPEQIQKLRANVANANGKILPLREETEQGKMIMQVIIPVDKKTHKSNRDVTFSHPVYGSTRLVNKTFELHNVYVVTIVNALRQKIFIDSNPQGATVFLDGKRYVKKTPIEIEDVSMNTHSLELKANDPSYNSLPSQLIKVDETNTRFFYDLRKKKNVSFSTDTKNAFMKLVDPSNGNKVIAEGFGGFSVSDLPYGGYMIESKLNGQDIDPISVTINGQTPSIYNVKVQESKAITFIAFQNNTEVKGAQVDLQGTQIGVTPLTYKVPFGNHRVSMSYAGQSKSTNIKVNKNSSNECKLILPNSYKYRSRWNPFDIDYTKRQVSFDFGYVQRWFTYSVKDGNESVSVSTDQWGEENRKQHGVQFGVVYNPYFGYGQGLITGLYYQLFFDTGSFDDAVEYDHNLYIPLLYQFRLPLAEECSLFLFGGIAGQFGIYHSVEWGETDDYYAEKIDIGYGYNEDYDLYMPNACQFYVPVGLGFQYKALQVEFKYSWGLNDNKEVYTQYDDVKQSFKAKMLEATLSIAF